MIDIVRGSAGWLVRHDGAYRALDATLAELLGMPLDKARAVIDLADRPAAAPESVLAPVDVQEVWAAGVTYQRSREGRREESGHADLYDSVYAAGRPELFFKSTATRVVGPGQPVGIRADSGWDVPEAEVGLVVNSCGEIFGYTIGNDVSSRSIEGDNPLYLPQAKVYTAACALGPGIVPAWAVDDLPFAIRVRVERSGEVVYSGETSTASLARTFTDLVEWLFKALDFPAGVVLLTGTGVVPDKDFTLREGDVTVIDVAGLGELRNPVRVVGAA